MLDWERLKEMLRFTGFGKRWLLWVDLRLSSAKVQILLNGVPEKKIVCKRGLNPLSPLMFVLVMDGPNKMFERTKAASWTKGLCNTASIKNLQYADDMLLVGIVIKEKQL